MEIWCEIYAFPDFEASSLGRIRRVANRKNSGPSGLIKPHLLNSGYLAVTLNYLNRTYGVLVHRLVIGAFIGPPPAGMEVNHRDSNKLNNSANNLEYVTRSANLIHSGSYRGERNSQARITTDTVREIRRLHEQGLGYKRIAKRLDITWGTVRNVVKGRTWSHV